MKTSKRGFTLIELLVVVSIISLLSSIALASVTSARLKARNAKRFQDLAQIRSALNLFYDTNNYYPVLPSGPCGSWNRSDAIPPGSICWSELGTALSPWLPVLPVDPRNLTTATVPPYSYIYVYQSVNNGTGYRLATVLEDDAKLGDGCFIGTTKPTNFPDSYYCLGINWQ